MKNYQRLFVFALLALAVTVFASPWAAFVWANYFTGSSGWPAYQYSFARIFDRVFMITAIGLFLAFRHYLKIGSLRDLGLQPLTHFSRDVFLGATLAIASMAALVAAMSLAGIFSPFARLSFSASMARFASALLAAVAAGSLEEMFFRGILFRGLREDLGTIRAYLLVSVIFAAIHFIRPADKIVLVSADPWAGVRHLTSAFHLFLDPVAILPGFFGLFLIGAILCYAFERTGSLYLSIGLHGGWIFALKTIRVFGDYAREHLSWLFGSGDPKLVSGAATWVGVALVALAVHRITQAREKLVPVAESGST